MHFKRRKGWTMRRGILAVGLACLLTFTTVTAPVSAADMPVKAPPPPVEEVEFCYACLLLIVPVALCIAFCGHHHHRTECTSAGGCFEVD